MQEGQDKIYYILAENYATAVASPHLEKLRKSGTEVLLLTDRIDPWVVDGLSEYDGKQLVDVARASTDLSEPEVDDKADDKAGEHDDLLKKIQQVLAERVAAVNVSKRLVDSPACVVAAEDEINPQVRRMLEAAGQEVPESKPILEVNVEHPLLTRLSHEDDDLRFEALSNIVLDHALLAEGSQLGNPAAYVQRVNQLILDLDTDD
jgi:molecular chaperone HtpG